jgi:hypothetical protein
MISRRQGIRSAFVSVLLAFGAAAGATNSVADETTLLVKSRDILSVAPKLEEETLIGKTVRVGDRRGACGTAKVIPKSGDSHEALLDQDCGGGLGLAYTGEARFVEIGSRKIASGAISSLVFERAKELGAGDIPNIELNELARVDLDGDDEPEILISAHTKRELSDPYSGKAGDIEAILVIANPDQEPKILDQVAKILEANEAKSGRPHIDLVALAQSPVTKKWALLMSQDIQRWEDETTTAEVSIGGKTTQQTTTQRRLTKATLAAVYTFEGGRLTPVQGLSYRLLSF